MKQIFVASLILILVGLILITLGHNGLGEQINILAFYAIIIGIFFYLKGIS